MAKKNQAAWDEYWAKARAVDILDVANRLGMKLKKTGADWTGSCLSGCATDDGFAVHPGKGIFLCRPSGATGDAVSMVEHVQSCSKAEALEIVTGEPPPDKSNHETPEQKQEREGRNAERQAAAARRRQIQEEAELADEERERRELARLQAMMKPIAGTHAELYLRETRGINVSPALLKDVRYVDRLEYWGFENEQTDRMTLLAILPAMVALFRDFEGTITGAHRTYLHPSQPIKFVPPNPPRPGRQRNAARKMLADVKGSMIRLGRLSETLALGEGIETTLKWFMLNRGGGDEVSLGVAGDLGNLAGGATGSMKHPTAKRKDGSGYPIPNRIPDPEKGGVIIPEGVTRVILLGDGDSEPCSTIAKLSTAGRRYRSQGLEVFVDMAPAKHDWDSYAKLEQMELVPA